MDFVAMHLKKQILNVFENSILMYNLRYLNTNSKHNSIWLC